jgi:hypothetical protein
MADHAGWDLAEEEELEAGEEETDQEEEADEANLLGEDEAHPFPSDEYLALAESLTNLHVANFAPFRLREAATAAGWERRGRQGARPAAPRCACCSARCRAGQSRPTNQRDASARTTLKPRREHIPQAPQQQVRTARAPRRAVRAGQQVNAEVPLCWAARPVDLSGTPQICPPPCRLRQSDLEAVRKLLRDGIAFGFDKVLRDHTLFSTSTVHEEDALFYALRALVELAALLLTLRNQATPPEAQASPIAQLVELDGELLQLATLVAALFARDTPLHEYHSATSTPALPDRGDFEVWAEPITTVRATAGGWQRGDDDPDRGEDDDEEPLVEEREHEWLTHLVNHFGINKGFHAIFYVRGGPGARGAARAGPGGCSGNASKTCSSPALGKPPSGAGPGPGRPQEPLRLSQIALSLSAPQPLSPLAAAAVRAKQPQHLPGVCDGADPGTRSGGYAPGHATVLQAGGWFPLQRQAVAQQSGLGPPRPVHAELNGGRRTSSAGCPAALPRRWCARSWRASSRWPLWTRTSCQTRARTAPTRRCAPS